MFKFPSNTKVKKFLEVYDCYCNQVSWKAIAKGKFFGFHQRIRLKLTDVQSVPVTWEDSVFDFCHLDNDLLTKPTLTSTHIVMAYYDLLEVSKVNTCYSKHVQLKLPTLPIII